MQTENSYWKIFNRRMKRFSREIDPKTTGAYSGRALIIFIPFVLIISLFEYWFTGNKK